ncbi:FtsH protease activity modulator HflK [Oxalobacter aliiformigenes]|uniref:FtsH protease activity modulator HflK n=1 Tax=Oxalobacter aliiformigenes TaxID=2946593 RepID=UPI002FCD937F
MEGFQSSSEPFISLEEKKDDEPERSDRDDDPFNDREARPRALKIMACVILLIATVFWLGTGVYSVEEGQTGVVMTFGRFSNFASPGINWRVPWPIQSHEVVNVSQVRTVEVGYRNTLRNKKLDEALMLTNDENIVDIQFAVQYKLKDAADWVFNNRDQEDMVRQVAESAIREVVGSKKMDFVLYEGRDQIAQDALRLMQEIFDQYRSGVLVTNVTMQGVQPPEQVQAAFDDAVKAGQDRERLKNEGQAYANDVIPRARGAAARLKEEAEAYKQKVIANAEGDASRFRQIVSEYQKAPVVTRDRMYLETMQQIFANTTKLMVDSRTGNNLLYLPLDKLISQTGTSGSDADVSRAVSSSGSSATGSSAEKERTREDRARGGR